MSVFLPANHAWGMPSLSKKWHVFHQAQSLCGRWLYTGSTDDSNTIGDGPMRDDCVKCHRLALKLLRSLPAPAKETP